MATAITSKKLSAELKVEVFDHDPADASVATKVAWRSMKGYESFMAFVKVTVGAIVTYKLFAADDSSGTNPVEIVAATSPTNADAAGDWLMLECTAEQLKEAGAEKTHVSAEVDMNASTDEGSVVYIRGGAHRKFLDLTPDRLIS